MTASPVAVLADDLIWSSRLAALLSALGVEPVLARGPASFDAALARAQAAIVDLTARAYDGVAAIERASAAGVRVLAIGQHDDVELLRRARAAGAERALAYRKLTDDGPAVLREWLDAGGEVPE